MEKLKSVLIIRFIVPIPLYTVSTKTKEDTYMKKHQKKHNPNLKIHRKSYPNAADSTYWKDKIVDGILSLVSTLGIITLFFFLATI